MFSASCEKAALPRTERARWGGRKRRRRRYPGAAFRLFLSKSYLECKTMNS